MDLKANRTQIRVHKWLGKQVRRKPSREIKSHLYTGDKRYER